MPADLRSASRTGIQPLLDQAAYTADLLEQTEAALKNLIFRLERAKDKETIVRGFWPRYWHFRKLGRSVREAVKLARSKGRSYAR